VDRTVNSHFLLHIYFSKIISRQ